MIEAIWRFIWGYVIVELKGNALERLLNKISTAGVELWDIQRILQGFRFRMAARDFWRLRNILRYRKCSVRIIEKRGLPFIQFRTVRRQALVVGVLLFFILVKTFASFLWVIKISGNDKVPLADLEKVVIEQGVHRGMPLSKVDLAGLEKRILTTNGGIIWADASIKGTCLLLKVVEKEIVEKPELTDIIAARSGVITHLMVCKGKSLVKEGDTVKAGDVLIKAASRREAFAEPDIEGNLPPYLPEEEGPVEKAIGIVMARTWYEGYGEAEKVVVTEVPTGRRERINRIQIGEKSFQFSGKTQIDFKSYKVEKEVKSIYIWRNIHLPIEVIKEEYAETVKHTEKRSLESARYLAQEQAMNSILNSLSPNAIIIQAKCFLIDGGQGDNNIIRVKVLLEAEEDIAKPLPKVVKEEG